MISWLPDHFKRRGFAYTRIRFDAVDAKKGSSPIAAVAELATAIAKLRFEAAKVRFNPNEIVLLGAGSGGHFATLLATDLKYLSASAVPPSAICAVVTINGEGFDIPRCLAHTTGARRSSYKKAFGDDVALQRAASPASHADAPNAGPFLIPTGADNPTTAAQGATIGALLRRAGTSVSQGSFPKWKRGARPTYVGTEENAGTKQVDSFILIHCR